MKRLILFEIILIFFATTFETDSPPGWFQQSISLGNKLITDIQFIDTSNGWVITDWGPSFDTAYIFRTSDGGNNWSFQSRYPASYTSMCMVNLNTGYITGGTGFGRVFKTTNGGSNWNLIYTAGLRFDNVFFVNENTGWISDPNISVGAGLLKTTDGGMSWSQQLNNTYRPAKLFFLNKDTGWVAGDQTGPPPKQLFRTTNGGTNWILQFSFTQQIYDIFFFNKDIGIVSSGLNQRTTNGGFNWTPSNNGGVELSFVNDSIGWAGNNFNVIMKSTNGGISWFAQTSPIFNAFSTDAKDTNKAWAGGSGVIHTTDGGGPPVGIQQISGEVPDDFILYQNYPNPFNPDTKIKYQITGPSNVRLIVYDIQGRLIAELVNQKHTPGVYEADWTASRYSSGIYLYSLIIDGKLTGTRKMILLK
jgi:Secretion system C-terminal sorting domain